MSCLERSCVNETATDWITIAPENEYSKGLQRIEARFAGHGYDPHRHDTYSFGYTISGVQSFDYRGERRDSVRGNSIVLHPDEVHDGRAGTEVGFQYRMLYLEPSLIRAALANKATSLPFVKTGISRHPILSKRIKAALSDLSRPLESLEFDQVVHELSEALLLVDSSAKIKRELSTKKQYSHIAVEAARAFLEEGATRQVDSKELENITGIERHELSRQFKMRLGTSPYRYLTMRRLAKVCKKIKHGKDLGDVAVSCGFSDQSHMTRAFKKAYGVTPGRWKKLVD